MGHPLLLVQLVVILLTARGLAWLLHWIGQPPVIGEMIAGLALGPLVFGALAPAWQGWLFAPASLPALDGLSQIGLVLFMFIVGAELRLPGGVRQTLRTAGTVGGLAVLQPLLRRWLTRHAADGRPAGGVLAMLLIGALGCAAITEWLHLHAVFGAFVFGLCLPRDDALLAGLIERLEHVAVIALMPVFFALTGLSTSVDAFHHHALGALALILLVAVAGKVVGGALGAPLDGHGWRDSFAVGSLMNARGMVELIVLKIGLDAGVIGREMFTLLLVMAIVTTMMTTPMLLYFSRHRRVAAVDCSRHPDQG